MISTETQLSIVNEIIQSEIPYIKIDSEFPNRIMTLTNNILDNSEYATYNDRERLFRQLVIKRIKFIKQYYKNRRAIDVYLGKLKSILMQTAYHPHKQNKFDHVNEFVHHFLIEALARFKREVELEKLNVNKRLLEAESLAFTNMYGYRNINVLGNRYLLVGLRYKTYCLKKSNFHESIIDFGDISQANENNTKMLPLIERINEKTIYDSHILLWDNYSNQTVLSKFIEYLKKDNQCDCIDYVKVYLTGLDTREIENSLDIDSDSRDYLQQRVKYHAKRFATRIDWELVNDWLGTSPKCNMGLSSIKYQSLLEQLDDKEKTILKLLIKENSFRDIAYSLNMSEFKVSKSWERVLLKAHKLRNN
jgi:DNA-binding CsgD family transcriptional regulator